MQLLPILVASVLALSAFHDPGPRIISTALCEVVRHREVWDGMSVQFRASVISDGIDHTALADQGCRYRVIPRISDRIANRADVKRFRRAVFVDAPRGTAFKSISATFIGILTWDGRVAVLDVQEIKDLSVVRRDRE